MILVDSSVWVDYFRGTSTPQVEFLDQGLGIETLVVGDLILAEVLQGFQDERDFKVAKRLLLSLEFVNLVTRDTALQAARNYRYLRTCGATVRKTIDTLIATSCIQNGFQLLHDDKDFEPFVAHLGLQVAYQGP